MSGGWKKPLKDFYGGKCKGITTDKDNANKFFINFAWDYPSRVYKGNYANSWRAKGGEQTRYLVEPEPYKGYCKNWVGKLDYDKKAKFPKSDKKTFYRNDWYPVTTHKLKKVFFAVRGVNDKGAGPEFACPAFEFALPKKPTINAISYNSDNGNVSTHIKFKRNVIAKADTYSVCYKRKVVKNFGPKAKQTETTAWTTSTNEDITVTYAPSWAKGLSENQRAKVTWYAYTKGIKGRSCDDPKTGKAVNFVTRTYVYAWPAVPTISSMSFAASRSEIVLKITTGHTKDNPVDTVTLEYYNETTAEKASDIGNVTWNTIEGMEDNANCTGFTVPYATVKPADGNRLWFRLKNKHGDYVRYSTPKRMKEAYKAAATAADDVCTILESSASLPDGKGIRVVVGCKNDSNTGTELSWSEYENAWVSTDEPTRFEATWSMSNNTDSSTNATWPKVHVIHLRGLEENVQYWLRARRFLEGDTKTFSKYSEKVAMIPVSNPTNVVVTVPDFIPLGSDLTVQWTYDSEAEQKKFNVFNPTASNKYTWISGEDSKGVAIIPYETIDEKIPYDNLELKDASGNNILDSSGNAITTEHLPWQVRTMDLAVKMTTGGSWKVSDTATVKIVEPPGVGMTVDIDNVHMKKDAGGKNILLRQGGSFVVHTTAKMPIVTLSVETDGLIHKLPDGTDASYLSGDIVWAGQFSDATGSENVDDDSGVGVEHVDVTCTLGEADLLDGADYNVYVIVYDESTGLYSETVTESFTVDWEHKAAEPIVTTEVNQDDLTVSIGVWIPEDAETEDVVDLYRVTADGVYLIAESLEWGSIVTDRYAPFQNGWGDGTYYRVATRTTDGDVAWTDDAAYDLYGYSLVFDWESNRLVLPYNIKISDTWAKGFEARKHMDGSYGGYFDSSVKRTASLDTAMIKVSDDEDKRLLRELAQYPAPVFVRTPTGSAYCANVDVSSMAYEFNKPDVDVSLKADEFKLVDEFRIDDGTDILLTGFYVLDDYLEYLEAPEGYEEEVPILE